MGEKYMVPFPSKEVEEEAGGGVVMGVVRSLNLNIVQLILLLAKEEEEEEDDPLTDERKSGQLALVRLLLLTFWFAITFEFEESTC